MNRRIGHICDVVDARRHGCALIALAMCAGLCTGGEPPANQPPPAMKLISRSVSAFASSGRAALANDASYNTQWRSAGVPATLSYDLSATPVAERVRLYLVWYNDDSYGYEHGSDGHGYNNLGAYIIEANSAPGGGAAPATGWVPLESVGGNVRLSRDHVVEFAGYNWIRINASASDGSPLNYDVAVNMDVYDASRGVTDGWLFAGDSITAGGMGHRNMSVDSESFTNQVGAIAGAFPPQENAGMPGFTSQSMLDYLPRWLRDFHGRFVPISLGTNDAAGNGPPEDFYSNMSALVKDVIAAGKIPLVPTIPWSRDPVHAAHIAALNAKIRLLYRNFPQLIPGPDLYALFSSNQELISPDGIHPTAKGYAALRAAWAASAAKSVYLTPSSQHLN